MHIKACNWPALVYVRATVTLCTGATAICCCQQKRSARLHAGRTAVVTGGSQGVGKVLARRFAEAGYNVVVVARKADRCHADTHEDRFTSKLHLEPNAQAVSQRYGVEGCAPDAFLVSKPATLCSLIYHCLQRERLTESDRLQGRHQRIHCVKLARARPQTTLVRGRLSTVLTSGPRIDRGHYLTGCRRWRTSWPTSFAGNAAASRCRPTSPAPRMSEPWQKGAPQPYALLYTLYLMSTLISWFTAHLILTPALAPDVMLHHVRPRLCHMATLCLCVAHTGMPQMRGCAAG